MHILFQHTAARRRLHNNAKFSGLNSCFNTQPPEGGCATYKSSSHADHSVSTHSRPKAAACGSQQRLGVWSGFNTQPPEGGCKNRQRGGLGIKMFQHTAARRRLQDLTRPGRGRRRFQHTAARRRLPERMREHLEAQRVSTHSRPKAAARYPIYLNNLFSVVSTHSRPKAAAGEDA